MTNQWATFATRLDFRSQLNLASLLHQWTDASKNLEVAKAAELRLRKEILKVYFPDGKDGTETIELDSGSKLKATFKQNFSLDKDTEKVDAILEKLEKSTKDGKFVADRLVKWKPEISVIEWRVLSSQHRKIVEPIVTIKSGQPSLELVLPKGTK